MSPFQNRRTFWEDRHGPQPKFGKQLVNSKGILHLKSCGFMAPTVKSLLRLQLRLLLGYFGGIMFGQTKCPPRFQRRPWCTLRINNVDCRLNLLEMSIQAGTQWTSVNHWTLIRSFDLIDWWKLGDILLFNVDLSQPEPSALLELPSNLERHRRSCLRATPSPATTVFEDVVQNRAQTWAYSPPNIQNIAKSQVQHLNIIWRIQVFLWFLFMFQVPASCLSERPVLCTMSDIFCCCCYDP